MGAYLTKVNDRLSFDFATYIQERDELAQDLRGLAADAAWHRQVKGSWQVVQGASGVAAGLAGSVALATAPLIGLGIPLIATTAVMVGNSMAAATLASSAASYGYGHVVDKDVAKRLRNLQHLIQSIAAKDREVSDFLKTKRALEVQPAPSSTNIAKDSDSSAATQSTGCSTTKLKDKNSAPGKSDVKSIDDSSNNNNNATATSDTVLAATSKNSKRPKIEACEYLCTVYDSWDLATKENKKITVGFDLARALGRSSGVFGGTNSIIEGSKAVKQEDNVETALLETAETLEKETNAIRGLDFRYFHCLPTESKLPRGRLQYIDNGGGQVDLVVSYDDHLGRRETLQSDSTQMIRLPEHSTNVEVRFLDRAGKMVFEVDRASPKQGWVHDEQGKRVVEMCQFDSADGVDAVFLVRGAVTHAYIHKAWDFGRLGSEPPREWEWWDNVAEEAKLLVPDIERRIASRSMPPPQLSSVSATCCQCLPGW
jgi:hypothetical protein